MASFAGFAWHGAYRWVTFVDTGKYAKYVRTHHGALYVPNRMCTCARALELEVFWPSQYN